MTSRVLFKIFQLWVVAGLVLLITFVTHRQSRYRRMRHEDLPKSNTKTTLVLMGYSTNRLDNYDIILPAYSDMDDVIDKIIFLWNNQEEEPPNVPMHGKVPIILVREPENSMNNRFGPDVTDRTETNVVTLVDDDCLLSRGMIRAMISSWEASSRDLDQRSLIGVDGDGRIVGTKHGYLFPCSRIEGWVLQRHCWNSIVSSSTPVSSNHPLNLVVGKTMTFSTLFMLAYQNDEVVWNYTSPQGGHFCEDIMMNALIRNATNNRDPVLMTKDRKWNLPLRGKKNEAAEIKEEHLAMDRTRTILSESGGLSFSLTVLSWNDKRSECVQWASTHYPESIWAEATTRQLAQ